MPKKRRLQGVILLFFICVVSCQPAIIQPAITTPSIIPSYLPPSDNPLAPSLWTAPLKSVFQIQLSDYPPDINHDADIFELDLFETTPTTIRFLHEQGKIVVCYFNAGAWEEYRPDADHFPKDVLGKPYIDWPGENWLDISKYERFSHLMEKRLNLAVEKDCDAVDPDNIDGYLQPTGFDLTALEQLSYNKWLSEQAHQRGLAIGMKNDGTQAQDLVNYFDFAVVEDCVFFDECMHFLPFIKKGKAVYLIEYTDHFNRIQKICDQSLPDGFNVLLKHRELGEYVGYCP